LVVAGNSSSGTRQAFGPPPANAGKPVWIAAPVGTFGPTRFVVEPETDNSNDGTRTVGLILLIVGVAGLVPLTAVSSSRRL
jgi:hypothetical protein